MNGYRSIYIMIQHKQLSCENPVNQMWKMTTKKWEHIKLKLGNDESIVVE